MMAITNQDQVSFHEATLVSVSSVNGRVSLSLDDVLIRDTRAPAGVIIDNVSVILRNDLPVSGVEMEEKDGEVLSVVQQEEWVLLVVQWNNFDDKTQNTVAYKFCGERVALHVG